MNAGIEKSVVFYFYIKESYAKIMTWPFGLPQYFKQVPVSAAPLIIYIKLEMDLKGSV